MQKIISSFYSSVLSIWLVSAATHTNSASAQTVSINEPRPLAKAALLWETHSGIPISYEDMPYVYSGDVTDETTPGFKQNHPAIRALSPRSGRLTLEMSVQMGALDSGTVAAGLQKAIDDHAANGNPGRFRLLQTTDGFVILPSSAADKSGALVPVSSPLDRAIIFAAQPRDGVGTLLAICQGINTAAGKDLVTLGVTPPSLQNQQTLVGADNETARNVLMRAIMGLQWSDPRNAGKIYKMSWRLLYGADTNVRKYALNVHVVETEANVANGATVKVPVSR